MRRPHVYERSAPRPSRSAYHEPSEPAASAAKVAEALLGLVTKAEVSGLSALAGLLEAALREAKEQAKPQAMQGFNTNGAEPRASDVEEPLHGVDALGVAVTPDV